MQQKPAVESVTALSFRLASEISAGFERALFAPVVASLLLRLFRRAIIVSAVAEAHTKSETLYKTFDRSKVAPKGSTTKFDAENRFVKYPNFKRIPSNHFCWMVAGAENCPNGFPVN